MIKKPFHFAVGFWDQSAASCQSAAEPSCCVMTPLKASLRPPVSSQRCSQWTFLKSLKCRYCTQVHSRDKKSLRGDEARGQTSATNFKNKRRVRLITHPATVAAVCVCAWRIAMNSELFGMFLVYVLGIFQKLYHWSPAAAGRHVVTSLSAVVPN